MRQLNNYAINCCKSFNNENNEKVVHIKPTLPTLVDS